MRKFELSQSLGAGCDISKTLQPATIHLVAEDSPFGTRCPLGRKRKKRWRTRRRG